MNGKYEGNVGNYSFIMQDDDVIEVWSDSNLEQAETYIFTLNHKKSVPAL